MRISDWSSDVCSSDLKILSHLKRIAGRDSLSEGRPLIEDAAFRAKLARAELELESVEATMLRALGGVSAERRLGVEANMIKIRGTELHQLLTELRMEALGYYAEPYVLSALLDGWNEPPVGPEYRSEEHTSELQSLMRISYAVFC